ncbi:hypothetical protein pb186bvf_013243 [Paramecium bursaria]
MDNQIIRQCFKECALMHSYTSSQEKQCFEDCNL